MALVVSGVAGLAVACGFVAVHQQGVQLERERQEMPRLGLARPVHAAPIYTAVDLPQFSTSGIVKTLNSIAKDEHVPLDEVAYVLDSTANLPYRRYRITLTANAAYPQVRKFVAVLAFEMPNMVLDSIRCARPDADAGTLGCELAFSAFFSKAEHG